MCSLILFFFCLQPSATKKYGKYIGTCVKVFDMTGLRLSALNYIKVSLSISWASILVSDQSKSSYPRVKITLMTGFFSFDIFL